MQEPLLIGWREWVSLPRLGLAAIKAKIDTGARSSSLHVDALETFEREGGIWLRFAVTPRRRGGRIVQCEAPALERRPVTDSGGRTTERWFIHSTVVLGGARIAAEINLTDRGGMLFPMLLGRTALDGRFRVDPGLSWVCGRHRTRGAAA